MKKSLNSSIDDAEWLEFLQSFLTPSDHVDSDLKLVFGRSARAHRLVNFRGAARAAGYIGWTRLCTPTRP